jgi:uncharacterized protein YbjT (DUF2867 family)
MNSHMPREIFVTGGTGYIGSRLIPLLLERGYLVRALVRAESEHKLPRGCTPIRGSALEAESFVAQIAPADTFVQLVGVAHPSPSKAEEFRKVDLVSVRAAVSAAKAAGIRHFVYVSVAHPAKVMAAYIEVRKEGERLLRESGMNASILRPWYVLGPGHRWPYLLLPVYFVLGLLPATRESARRLGLVTLGQMLRALVAAVENPPAGIRVWEVPEIRQFSERTPADSSREKR